MSEKMIPDRQEEAMVWLRRFSQVIGESPSVYQLTSADADSIAAVVDPASVAFDIGMDPATRTTPTIATKNEQLTAARQFCRVYAKLIKYNMGILSAAKLAIGIKPPTDTVTPIECPQSSPSLLVAASTPGAQTLQFRDSLEPERRAKPFGATCLQLWVTVADENATNMDDARCLGNFTTNPVGVAFDMSERGKQATYWGRWGGKRNQFGQWSLPLSMTIAA